MTSTYSGWTIKQIAYAKHRYNDFVGTNLPASGDGIFDLQEWCGSHGWPEPLTIKLVGFIEQYDYEWARKAFRNACLSSV